GIRLQCASWGQPGSPVRLHGGTDITALGVCDHHEPCLACGCEHVFESRVPWSSEALVERDLRLDDAHAARCGPDHAESELPGASRRVLQAPLPQQPAVRVDPDTQVAIALEGRLQALPETNQSAPAFPLGRLRSPATISRRSPSAYSRWSEPPHPAGRWSCTAGGLPRLPQP